MPTNTPELFVPLLALCQELTDEFHMIPKARQQKLSALTDYIIKKRSTDVEAKLVVICTHNSRRSHLGQLWLAVAADYYGVAGIHTYSGGTEATAFNYRMIEAVKKAGFQVLTTQAKTDNPHYHISWQNGMEAYEAFSKKHSAAPNPQKDFAAIMVCTSADDACPIVGGAAFRLSLPYEDPKAFDDTELEAEKYMERLKEIGREMLFVMSSINS